jgi:hypothetical protein
MIKFLNNLALIRAQNTNFFADVFGENILKIMTSVPGHPGRANTEKKIIPGREFK